MATKLSFTDTKLGPLARPWVALYEQCSAKPLPSKITGVTAKMTRYIETLYTAQGLPLPEIEIVPGALMRTPLQDTGVVLVAFSGGKDGAATALHLRSQGFTPVLFYVKGINSKSYAGEQAYVERVAATMAMELVQVVCKQTGHTEYPDNPTKNQMILSLMVEFAARSRGGKHSGSRFAMGNLSKENLAECNVNFTYSDAREMYDAADESFAHQTQGTFVYMGGVMAYETQSYITIHRECPQVLDVMLSCLAAYRHRARIRMANETKFGVTLRAECCGTCYKCASEYMHRVALGLSAPVPAYIQRCITLLQSEHQRLANLTARPSAQDAVNFFIDKTLQPNVSMF